MIKMYPTYFDVKDWRILEARTIHAFNLNETPIEVVKVEIGRVLRSTLIFEHYEEETFPIIRWISRAEYNKLNENEGIIIW